MKFLVLHFVCVIFQSQTGKNRENSMAARSTWSEVFSRLLIEVKKLRVLDNLGFVSLLLRLFLLFDYESEISDGKRTFNSSLKQNNFPPLHGNTCKWKFRLGRELKFLWRDFTRLLAEQNMISWDGMKKRLSRESWSGRPSDVKSEFRESL